MTVTVETCGRGVNTATYGRNDLEAFFEKSGILEDEYLTHTPFLVFLISGNCVRVIEVHNAIQLATNFPPETKVMVQWAGKFRSDYFQMTVKDVQWELTRRGVLPKIQAGRCSDCDRRAERDKIGHMCLRRWLSDTDEVVVCTGQIIPDVTTRPESPAPLNDVEAFMALPGRCTDCRRGTGGEEIGNSCRMIQPTGSHCRGRIVKAEGR